MSSFRERGMTKSCWFNNDPAHHPALAFNLGTELTGGWNNNAWTAYAGSQRIFIDLRRSRDIKRLRMINGFTVDVDNVTPTSFDSGLKNVLIYTSVFAPTTVYQSGLANNTLIFAGQLPMNSGANSGKNYYDIPLSSSTIVDTGFPLVLEEGGES